ncbi:MAG TPA: hypothetical protein VFA04_20745 [Bryobacteraceae bacterium]|nr:hypothetical protein [Bryobacteraceae bacterium]
MSLLKATTILLALTQGAAIVRLLSISVRHYRWFAATIFLSLGVNVALLMMDVNGAPYLHLWLISYPLYLVGIVAGGLEILSRIPDQYAIPRQQLNRQRLITTFQVALLIAVTSAIVEISGVTGLPTREVWIRRLLLVSRVTTFLIALLLLFAERFVSLVPVPFQRNLLIHARLFGAWVMLNSVSVLVDNFVGYGPKWSLVANGTSIAASILFLGWVFLLKPKGEDFPERRQLTSDEETRLRQRRQEMVSAVRRALSR